MSPPLNWHGVNLNQFHVLKIRVECSPESKVGSVTTKGLWWEVNAWMHKLRLTLQVTFPQDAFGLHPFHGEKNRQIWPPKFHPDPRLPH